jgi:hypothetical protein
MFQNIFKKAKIPKNVNKDMQELIKTLKKSKSKRKCIKKAYFFLSKKYKGNRINTYLRFFDLFTNDVNKIWAKNGFLHCHIINYLMRILLIKSGHFTEDDIKLKWTLVWYISPHQYLNIKINEKESINIDIWGKVYGIKFGDYAHGFN